jgi:7-carboxy-7-deazaguanine synthase
VSAGDGTIPISETFTSIQGEGKLTGVPSFFIRVSGCNLRCAWCDTPYASWDPRGSSMSVEDLVVASRGSGVSHVVLTGGEPMIFPQVEALCAGLREAGLHITIETAGTVSRPVACDLMSLSPKLANSTPPAGDPRDPSGAWRSRHEQRRIDIEALQALIDAHAERQLKFVVAEPADLDEIDVLLGRLSAVAPADVMLMPEGVEPAATGALRVVAPTPSQSESVPATLGTPARRGWVVGACISRGWRYCHRVHIDLFGNARGT